MSEKPESDTRLAQAAGSASCDWLPNRAFDTIKCGRKPVVMHCSGLFYCKRHAEKMRAAGYQLTSIVTPNS